MTFPILCIIAFLGLEITMANLFRRWSIRSPKNCNVQISLYLLLGTIHGNFHYFPLKMGKLESILRGGLPSPNQIFSPSHILETFGEVSEDDPVKILQMGHLNSNSAMKFLLFEILISQKLKKIQIFLAFQMKFPNSISWTHGEKLHKQNRS